MYKLLQIDSCLNMYSTGHITESIAKLALNRGWDCYIVHGSRYVRRPSCMKDIQSVSKFGEYIHFIESILFDNHGLASRRATRRVVEQIKQIKPDVIQLHCIHGYYLNYKILFEFLNSIKIPVIWTFHDCWAFTGHCAHFMSVGCYKWRDGGCFQCPLTGDYPKSIFDFSKRNYKLKKSLFMNNKNIHIVTVSKWLESVTRESFFSGKDIFTIYNGIDTKVFRPLDDNSLKKEMALENKHVLVAAATSWSKYKGLFDYISLSSLFEDDVVFILIGLTDNQINSMPSNIVGLKRTSSALELAKYYSMADIVLNLSYQETFGLTTIEGMACGTPGIVYNTTASPELITSETGFIVEPGDINGVYHAITEILKKGKESYSNACRARVQMLYDKDKIFSDYVDFYESLIKE